MTTLSDALLVALRHWEGRPGVATMASGCNACTSALLDAYGPLTAESLGPSHAVAILAGLRTVNLSPKSAAIYYGAFRRMLALNGIPTPTWPNAPTPPRRTREALRGDPCEALRMYLWGRGWTDTADLLTLMRGTGLRVNREARDLDSLTFEAREGEPYDLLHVVGKGANERLIPVVREDTRTLLRDGVRMAALQGRAYSTHTERWRKGVAALGINSRLATPHAVRHGYATEAYEKSHGNLALVQELLGHADPATTARYVTVNMQSKVGALST